MVDRFSNVFLCTHRHRYIHDGDLVNLASINLPFLHFFLGCESAEPDAFFGISAELGVVGSGGLDVGVGDVGVGDVAVGEVLIKAENGGIRCLTLISAR